jgi:hypothetical protein
MSCRFLTALTVCAFSLVAFGDDKIGEGKPADIAKKVRAEMAKKKGYHVNGTINYPDKGVGKPPCASPQSGIVKGDFAHLGKGTCFTFHKAEKFALR